MTLTGVPILALLLLLAGVLVWGTYTAWQRWGEPPSGGWQTPSLNRAHEWVYRGQVVPSNREVTVILEVTEADDDSRRLTADGFLAVDGRIIYQMTGFTLE